jgi:hypothetical protein
MGAQALADAGDSVPVRTASAVVGQELLVDRRSAR